MLYIHIGRGKAGSTSIQSLASRNRDVLARAGLIYPTIGQFRHSHAGIGSDLRAGRDSLDLRELEAVLSRDPDGRYFISAEHLFNVERGGIERLLRSTAGHEVRVIAYIRDYASWIQSHYAQDTKTGRNPNDFDQYFERKIKVASAVPMLSQWAHVVGWDRIRVRSLAPGNLAGGGLSSDILDALLGPIPPETIEFPGVGNPAPAWQLLELRRTMAMQRGRRASDAEARAERRIMKVFRTGLRWSGEPQSTRYLTLDQIRRATELFNSDVAIMNRKTGSRIPPHVVTETAERPFLPSFSSIAPHLRSTFFRRLAVRIAVARVLPIKESRNLPVIRETRRRLRCAERDVQGPIRSTARRG